MSTENHEDRVASLVEVRNYFGYSTLKEFKADWEQLSTQDRVDIRSGIGNGTYTY